MKPLRAEDVQWIDEPYEVPHEEIVPGMVIESEYGDFDNWVQDGVLMHCVSKDHPNSWFTYGTRVSQTDWSCLDEMYSFTLNGGGRLVGYFDVDAYLADNPDIVLPDEY